MYTLVIDEGIVIRDADGVQVAPCQSVSDQSFIEYNAWVLAGNTPVEIATRTLTEGE